VFEVDHPLTQARKRDVIVRRLRVLPSHVRLVPIDFGTDVLDTVMPRAGFRSGVKTFLIWEASAGVGSRMVFTYIHRTILDGSVTFAGAARTLATVRRGGEPYTWGVDPAELPGYLAARALVLVEDVGASAYRERYLAPLGRGHEPLAEFQRAALVEVAGQPSPLSAPGTSAAASRRTP
jgi:O-methyltransferase involved in polyketide biosynthesis